MAGRGRLRLLLAAERRGGERRLAALFPRGTLDLLGLRLVLELRLLVGLGAVPLRTLVQPPALGLVLAARHDLGAVLGELALHGRLLWLGAAPARGVLHERGGLHLLWQLRRHELRIRAG